MNNLTLFSGLKKRLRNTKELIHPYYDRIRAKHFGLASRKRVQCNICGWQGAKFLNFYSRFSHVYFDAVCWNCHSHPRHRYLHLYLKQYLLTEKPLKVLHFAPEAKLTELITAYDNINYLSVDIDPSKAMQCEDITKLSFADKSFDIIICIHVLEHVQNDHQAMQEMRRVLADDGLAMIDVPIAYLKETTYEDPTITTPEARTKAYWQWDHLRLYGRDFPSKLEAAGFNVTVDTYIETLGDDVLRLHGLEKNPIFLCRR